MSMRVLIGYDGTDRSRAAVEDLVFAGLPRSAAALVVTVGEPSFPGLVPRDDHSIASEGAALTRDLFPGWSIRSSVSVGDPAEQLLSYAGDFRPDLIVVGSAGRPQRADEAQSGRVLPGLIEASRTSLRIARSRLPHAVRPPRLLVGFDASFESKRVVAELAERDWPADTRARLLSIEGSGVLGSIESLSPSLRAAAIGSGFASRWAETLGRDTWAEFAAAGIAAELDIWSGQSRRGLLDAADDWDADCIFLPFAAAGPIKYPHIADFTMAAISGPSKYTIEFLK
jgi:nucleotide-binding universal stress UspA family protein